MFDRHIHQHGAHYPQSITVHEHRAPTDESMRLLHELEEKALANVISKLTPPGNEVRGVVVEWGMSGLGDRAVAVAFELNRRKYDVRVDISRDMEMWNKEKAWKLLFEEIGKAIVGELFEAVFASRGKL